MARPRKKRSDLKTHRVSFTVEDGPYMRLQYDAAAASIPIAALARQRACERSARTPAPPQTPYTTLDPAVYAEIKRIGVNINQAIKRFHKTDRIPPELTKLAATIDRILHQHLVQGGEADGSKGRR